MTVDTINSMMVGKRNSSPDGTNGKPELPLLSIHTLQNIKSDKVIL